MTEDLIILLGWFCGICSVLLLAELVSNAIKYFINRKSMKRNALRSRFEH